MSTGKEMREETSILIKYFVADRCSLQSWHNFYLRLKAVLKMTVWFQRVVTTKLNFYNEHVQEKIVYMNENQLMNWHSLQKLKAFIVF